MRLTYFGLCDNHQRIEVNFDCQKVNSNFQCQVINLNLFEGDKNAETYLSSQPPQAPNDIRVVNSSIFYIPSHFFKAFSEIKEFVADNCSIHEIYHETFSKASKLHYLVLSFNNIQIIPDYTFRSNTEMQILKLDHNEIQRITTDAFRGLFSLRQLKLSNNMIRYLPLYLFHDLKKLESLELNHNMISVISSGQFVTNEQLSFIDLHNNSLTIIDNDAFDDILKSLTYVDLNHNTCVNGSIQTSNNFSKLIECCSTSAEEIKSCLVSRQEDDEKGFGAWIFFLVLIILANVSLLIFIVIKRRLHTIFLRNQEEHYELTGSVYIEESADSDQYY